MNRYKATLILAIVTIGYLLSCPFNKTFIGGLISSGFGAAMIGGFADWYGITALFRKPLGVPFKTQLIAKNREKIFDGLSNMVSEELLTKEYLKELLNEYDVSKLIIKFVSNSGENNDTKKLINLISEESLAKLDSNEIGKVSSDLIMRNMTQFNLWRVINSAIDISITSGYDDKVINFVIDELVVFSKTDNFKGIMIRLVDDTKRSYEHGMARRAAMNAIVLEMIMRLSSDKIATIVLNKIVDYLNGLKDLDNSDRLKLKQWLYIKLNELKESEGIKERIEVWKMEQIKSAKLQKYVANLIENLKNNNLNEESISGKVINEINKLTEKFNESTYMQSKVDIYLKKALNKFIDKAHENLGKIVRENLDKYSDDMLIDLVESKAGDDLQLIRINGSLVGGLVGILIFILTYMI